MTRADRPLADEIRTLSELRDAPKRQEIVAGTIEEGTVVLVAGTYATGKTFHCTALAGSIATGEPWYGRPTLQRKVLYIAAEGVYGMASRFDAWATHHNYSIPERQLEILTMPVQLSDKERVAELCKIVEAYQYQVVVIDTLSKSMVGQDENGAKDMSEAVDAAYEILDATKGGNVLLVHHTGKDKTTIRGSSVLEAGVDIVYLAEADGNLFRLKRLKHKDGPRDDERSFELIPVPGTDSVTLSVRWDADITDKAKELLSVLVRNFGDAGATKAELRTVADMAPATFHRSLKTLLERGHINNSGSEHRPHYKPTNKGNNN